MEYQANSSGHLNPKLVFNWIKGVFATLKMAPESDISDKEIAAVVQTWEQVRNRFKDFYTEFGLVVLNRLFDLEPTAKSFFGYDKSEEMGNNNAIIHSTAFTCLFDSIFQMLTSPLEESSMLPEILEQVGQKHKMQGVNPSLFASMGQAYIYAIETSAEYKLSKDERQMWEDVFNSVSRAIVKTILK